MQKNRNFCFTWNNYTAEDIKFIEEDVATRVKYIAFCEEVAPTTGTKHLQGYVSFNNPRTIKQARIFLPGCHVETMLGSMLQNERYCSKAGTLIEFGEKPVMVLR